MKAVYIEKNGGPEVLTYGDFPDPTAEEGKIVVDIHAASINGADWKVRQGGSYGEVPYFPYILGRDFSGVVAEVGPGVTDFVRGDAVFGVLSREQAEDHCEEGARRAGIRAR